MVVNLECDFALRQYVAMLGDIFNGHDLGVLPASSEARPRMLLNIFFCTASHTHTKNLLTQSVSNAEMGKPCLRESSVGIHGWLPHPGQVGSPAVSTLSTPG